MYINEFQSKLHREHPNSILGQQLKGWVFESHAWVVVSKTNQHHKICRWCKTESKTDMVCEDPDKILCPENPVIKALVEQSLMQAKVGAILPEGGA